jgi:hypothetical protein
MSERSERWSRLVDQHITRRDARDQFPTPPRAAPVSLLLGLALPWVPALLFASGAEGLAVALAVPLIIAIGVSLLVLFANPRTQLFAAGLLLGCISVFLFGIALVD